MGLLNGLKKLFKDKHEQIMDSIIEDFYMKFNGSSLVKTTQRPLDCRYADKKLILQLQNKDIYTTIRQMIEEEYDWAKLKLSIISLNNPAVKARIEKVKAELLEWAERWYKLRENSMEFPEEDMKRLYELEMKYGNERSIEYLRSIDKELEIRRCKLKSLGEYEECAIVEGEKRGKSQYIEIQPQQRGVTR
ncbi:MAG: hypothetical protein ACOX2N_00925 [Peptococcia bacterium]|jgi:hypothetical protein